MASFLTSKRQSAPLVFIFSRAGAVQARDRRLLSHPPRVRTHGRYPPRNLRSRLRPTYFSHEAFQLYADTERHNGQEYERRRFRARRKCRTETEEIGREVRYAPQGILFSCAKVRRAKTMNISPARSSRNAPPPERTFRKALPNDP